MIGMPSSESMSSLLVGVQQRSILCVLVTMIGVGIRTVYILSRIKRTPTRSAPDSQVSVCVSHELRCRNVLVDIV